MNFLPLVAWLAAGTPVPPLPILPEGAPRSQAIVCAPAEVGAPCQLELEGRIVSRVPGVKLEAFEVEVIREVKGSAPDTLWVVANIPNRRGLIVGGRFRFTIAAKEPFAPFDVLVIGHTRLPPARAR